MRLALRITALLLVVLGFSMGLTGFLNYSKYETSFLNLLQSRLLVVGQGLRDTAETSLNLGLTLGELENVEQLVRREAGNDPNIIAISIVDAEGRRLFSSDPTRERGSMVEGADLAPLRQGESDWRILRDDALVVGLGVTNPFGQASGAVLIHYSTRFLESELGAVRRTLIRDGLVVLALAGSLSLLACSLILQALNASLRRVERDLGRLDEIAVAPSTAEAAMTAKNASALEAGAAGFSRTIAGALQELREAERLLEDGRPEPRGKEPVA